MAKDAPRARDWRIWWRLAARIPRPDEATWATKPFVGPLFATLAQGVGVSPLLATLTKTPPGVGVRFFLKGDDKSFVYSVCGKADWNYDVSHYSLQRQI